MVINVAGRRKGALVSKGMRSQIKSPIKDLRPRKESAISAAVTTDDAAARSASNMRRSFNMSAQDTRENQT